MNEISYLRGTCSNARVLVGFCGSVECVRVSFWWAEGGGVFCKYAASLDRYLLWDLNLLDNYFTFFSLHIVCTVCFDFWVCYFFLYQCICPDGAVSKLLGPILFNSVYGRHTVYCSYHMLCVPPTRARGRDTTCGNTVPVMYCFTVPIIVWPWTSTTDLVIYISSDPDPINPRGHEPVISWSFVAVCIYPHGLA